MLRHLFESPVRRAEREIEFAKYVEMHKSQTAPTDPELVTLIKSDFYNSHSGVERSRLDQIWGFLEPKFQENVGLSEFTKDNNGQLSDYFFPWIINVFRSPATALEMSYGAGPHLDGSWHEDILSTEDPLVPFIMDDPAFVYNRERQLHVANLVMSIQDMVWDFDDCPAKIIDFGAGRLAWARRHGYSVRPRMAVIYAFDKDPSINPATLFKDNLEELGIKYKHSDFIAQLNNPDCEDADLIILGGIASYISPDVFAEKIIPALYLLLKPLGAIFFDFQLDCPCYRHSMDILGWPAFDIPKKASEIIDRVEAMRHGLWAKGIRFNAEYNVDTFNRLPSAVMITMQKVE